MGKTLSLLGAVCLALVPVARVDAQLYSADAVKAAFVYRFAAYVEWPPAALTHENFTIAVAGSSGIVAELRRLLPDIAIGTRPARLLDEVSAADLHMVDILVIGADAGAAGHDLIAAAAGQPVLTITEQPRGLAAGGVINFVRSGSNVRFEISLPAAQRQGLRLSSALLAVAEHVENK